jgi:sulfoxide reductase heme-binding subunit YedZ
MTASTATDALWYAGRGAGVVSLVMLTVVVVLGIAARSGRPAFGLPTFAVSAVHRNAALLAVGMLVVHVGTLFLDPYAQLRVLDVLVPFQGAYRPFWLGLGTVAGQLIVVLIVTSLLRGRIGQRAWRAIHWVAYAAWPVAMLHAIGNGTDNGSLWFIVLAIVCSLAVLAAVGWRLSERFAETTGGRPRQPISTSRSLTTGADR